MVYGLGHVAQQVLGLVFVPIFTRFLAVGDYGVLSAVNVLFFLVSALVPLGLGQAVVRLVFDARDRDEQRRLVGNGLVACLILTGTVTPILVWLAPEISRGLFGDAGQAGIVRLAFLALPGSTVRTYALGVLRARFRKWAFGLVSVTSVLLLGAFNVLTVVVLGMGVTGIFLGGLVSLSVVGGLALVLVRHELRPGLSLARLRPMLAYGVPLVPAGLAFWVLASVDRLLLARLLGTASVGLYEVGSKVAAVVGFATTAIYQAYVPLSYEMAAGEDADRGYGRIVVAYVTAMGGLALALSAFGREIVALLAAREYREGAVVVPWLVTGVAVSGAGTILATGIHLARRTVWVTVVTLVAAGSNVVLNLFWIPAYDITGAAAATLVSYALMVVGLAVAAQRLHRIAYPWLRIAAPGVAAGAGILVAAWTESWVVRAGIVGAYGLLVAGARVFRRS